MILSRFFQSLGYRRANGLILIAGFILTAFANLTFFAHTQAVYPFFGGNTLFVASLFLFLWAFHSLLMLPFAWAYTLKPLLIVMFMLSAVTAYFMDTYRTVIDAAMINNLFATHTEEVLDLVSLKYFLYVGLLGVLPSFVLLKLGVIYGTWKQELLQRFFLFILLIGVMVLVSVPLGNYYASFIREHRIIRSYANPSYVIHSMIQYVDQFWVPKSTEVRKMAENASINLPARRRIAVMVVGEAARADHFSLNGYARDTNPKIRQEGVISLKNVRSCGTSTAISVPCMFSLEGMKGFGSKREKQQENLLDVLQRLGVKVLWLDNNSDSKGVALRVPYQRYLESPPNMICNPECRDEGMLPALTNWIDSQNTAPILVVLHQMGNHGPSYFKRYPPPFLKWTPVCETNQLEQCSPETIINAYDNSTLFTDDFLAKTINALKPYAKTADTLMFYVADHGESLGENGLYLHGLPYALAPDTQTHVASVMWVGQGASPALQQAWEYLPKRAEAPLNHDIIVQTLLGYFGVQTTFYQPKNDLLTPPPSH